jgi:rod shape-determining protein MreD
VGLPMTWVRTVGVATLLLAAAVSQGVLVTRLPWPGPGEPQLPALAVLAVALSAGPRPGAVAGFATGLTVDLLPPATHAVGQWAFVLCLLGYLVGMVAQDAADSVLLAVALGAVGAALAPLLFTGLGVTLGDPRAHPLGALERLPSVALWTLVLAVFVLGPVRWRRADRVVTGDSAPGLASLALR